MICSMTRTEKPKRRDFTFHASRLLGWLSEKRSTSSPGFKSMPLETRLLPSLVLRVRTISSGFTPRNSASSLRVDSFPSPIFTRLGKEGSRSMSRVSRSSVSTTGIKDGQRLAAFMTPRPGGMKNCSRTVSQNFSPGFEGVGESGFDFAQVLSDWDTHAVAPASAKDRAKPLLVRRESPSDNC